MGGLVPIGFAFANGHIGHPSRSKKRKRLFSPSLDGTCVLIARPRLVVARDLLSLPRGRRVRPAKRPSREKLIMSPMFIVSLASP
jgi:hypothetical protein